VKLSELLGEENVLLDFKARDKWEAIERLVEALVAHGKVKPGHRRQVLDALVARENVASTGMGLGVAIPHAWTDLLDTGTAAVAISPQGIPFQSADGKKIGPMNGVFALRAYQPFPCRIYPAAAAP